MGIGVNLRGGLITREDGDLLQFVTGVQAGFDGEFGHGRRRYERQRTGLDIRCHDVFQHGIDRGMRGERGQTPISTMWPSQTGQTSIRWPVSAA